MLIFGHIGVTLVIIFLIVSILKIETNHKLYIFVIIGSILPDLIDKPIGEILLAGSLSHGRLFAHSLLFVFILSIVGIYIYKKRKEKGFIFLSFASFIHLCIDEMWLDPKTLFFPFLGFNFRQGVMESNWTDYFLNIYYRVYSPIVGSGSSIIGSGSPMIGSGISYIFITELIGMCIISIYIFRFFVIKK